MYIAGDDDGIAGSHDGHNHGLDGTGCSVDRKECRIRTIGVSSQSLSFFNGTGGMMQRIHQLEYRNVYFERVFPYELFEFSIDSLALFMPRDVKGNRIPGNILHQSIK